MLFQKKNSLKKKVMLFFYFAFVSALLITNFAVENINNFIRTEINNILEPEVAFLQSISKSIINLSHRLYNSALYDNKVRSLESENDALKLELIKKNYLLSELSAYKDLNDTLNGKHQIKSYVHVIGLINTEYKHITVSASNPVEINDLVLDEYGLVGKVIKYFSYNNTATIQLLEDQKFRVPAMTTTSFVYGMISGVNELNPKCKLEFKYYDDHVTILEGELIVTSGEFMLTKKNILIGKITSIDSDNHRICVEPIAKLKQLNNLVVISNK